MDLHRNKNNESEKNNKIYNDFVLDKLTSDTLIYNHLEKQTWFKKSNKNIRIE